MKRFSGALGLAALLIAASTRGADPGTLFVHLGGAAGVEAIAGALIDQVASDPVLGRSFKDSNLKRVKQHLTEQLCVLAGGPCQYTGDPMREVHGGHGITEAEFYGMVGMLRGILKARGVALADRNHLLELLAPLKRDVVRVPAGG